MNRADSGQIVVSLIASADSRRIDGGPRRRILPHASSR